jgi:hypothetical protein
MSHAAGRDGTTDRTALSANPDLPALRPASNRKRYRQPRDGRYRPRSQTPLARRLGTVHSAPEQARRTLIRIWQLQFADGRTWHQLFPRTSEGGLGLAAEHPEWPQWFSDDHLGLRVPA